MNRRKSFAAIVHSATEADLASTHSPRTHTSHHLSHDTLRNAADFIATIVRTLQHVMSVNEQLSADLLTYYDRDDWHETMYLERTYVSDSIGVFAIEAEKYIKAFREAAGSSSVPDFSLPNIFSGGSALTSANDNNIHVPPLVDMMETSRATDAEASHTDADNGEEVQTVTSPSGTSLKKVKNVVKSIMLMRSLASPRKTVELDPQFSKDDDTRQASPDPEQRAIKRHQSIKLDTNPMVGTRQRKQSIVSNTSDSPPPPVTKRRGSIKRPTQITTSENTDQEGGGGTVQSPRNNNRRSSIRSMDGSEAAMSPRSQMSRLNLSKSQSQRTPVESTMSPRSRARPPSVIKAKGPENILSSRRRGSIVKATLDIDDLAKSGMGAKKKSTAKPTSHGGGSHHHGIGPLPEAVNTLHCELRLQMERANEHVHRLHRAVRVFTGAIETLCLKIHDLTSPIDPFFFATSHKQFLMEWMPIYGWLCEKDVAVPLRSDKLPFSAGSVETFQESELWRAFEESTMKDKIGTQRGEDYHRHSPHLLMKSMGATMSRCFKALSTFLIRVEHDKADLLHSVSDTMKEMLLLTITPKEVEQRRLKQLLEVSTSLGINSVLSGAQRKMMQGFLEGDRTPPLPSPRSVFNSIVNQRGQAVFLPHHYGDLPVPRRSDKEINTTPDVCDVEVQVAPKTSTTMVQAPNTPRSNTNNNASFASNRNGTGSPGSPRSNSRIGKKFQPDNLSQTVSFSPRNNNNSKSRNRTTSNAANERPDNASFPSGPLASTYTFSDNDMSSGLLSPRPITYVEKECQTDAIVEEIKPQQPIVSFQQPGFLTIPGGDGAVDGVVSPVASPMNTEKLKAIMQTFEAFAEADSPLVPPQPIPEEPLAKEATTNTDIYGDLDNYFSLKFSVQSPQRKQQQQQQYQCAGCRKSLMDLVDCSPYISREQVIALEMYNRYATGNQPPPQFMVNKAQHNREVLLNHAQ
eukprot:PhF_6_TR25465/c0_g1_i12/m.35315